MNSSLTRALFICTLLICGSAIHAKNKGYAKKQFTNKTTYDVTVQIGYSVKDKVKDTDMNRQSDKTIIPAGEKAPIEVSSKVGPLTINRVWLSANAKTNTVDGKDIPTSKMYTISGKPGSFTLSRK